MEKINKRQARKLYERGIPFWITPCKAPHYCGVLIGATASPYNELRENYSSFDAMVNAFEYYNCGNGCGRYAAFYTAE